MSADKRRHQFLEPAAARQATRSPAAAIDGRHARRPPLRARLRVSGAIVRVDDADGADDCRMTLNVSDCSLKFYVSPATGVIRFGA